MALKIVDTTSLDAVANALNERTNTNGAISFPDGFVNKISNELSSTKVLRFIVGKLYKEEYTANELKGITNIGHYAFKEYTSIKRIYLPSSCIAISYFSFEGCSKLEQVYIPRSVQSIGVGAFKTCQSLKFFDMTSYGQDGAFPTLSNSNAFLDTPSDMKIIVPHGRKAELAAMTNWSSFASQIVDDIKGGWTFNDSVGTANIDKTFNVKGIYDGKEFSTIHLGTSGYNYIAIDGEQIHDSGMWFGSKEITFTQSYAEIEDGVELMAWFNANATAI